MAGSPLKHERKRVMNTSLIDAAIKWSIENGRDPKEYMHPIAERLWKMAMEGELDDPVTLAAIKEVVDRTDGKAVQEITVDKTETRLVDAGLVGEMGEILRLARLRALAAKPERVIEADSEPE